MPCSRGRGAVKLRGTGLKGEGLGGGASPQANKQPSYRRGVPLRPKSEPMKRASACPLARPSWGARQSPPAAVRGGACGRPRAPHALPFVSPWRRRRGLRTRTRKPPGSEEATATMVVRGPRGHQSVCPRASLSARPRPARPAPGPARARGPPAAPHPPSWSPTVPTSVRSWVAARASTPPPQRASPPPSSEPCKRGDSGGGPRT